MGIFSFLKADQPATPPGDVIDQILDHTKSIVVREDLIAHIIQNLKRSAPSQKSTRDRQTIQTYLLLEDFIIHNKPMVVTRAYTKDELRDEIRSKFPIQKLPEEFRLIFLPHIEQLFHVYTTYTSELAQYILNQVGPTQLQAIYSTVTKNTPFAGIDVTTTQAKPEILKHLSEVSENDLTQLFTKVNTALYQNIANSFGENSARELTQHNYYNFKEIYDYDLITMYLRVIPAGILDKERVAFMTRSDLENEAMSMAVEKLRREMAESSAKQLQEEKSIIEKKVQEQTAVIRSEKEALKIAVLQAQENEAKLLASVRGLTLGFILTDTTNSILTINYAARRILKLYQEIENVADLERFMGKKFDFISTIEECKKTGSSKEFKEVDWNSSILHISVSPVFLNNLKNEYIGSVLLIDDVTEEKRLERTKDEFFAIASHELRTPLTAIRGSVSIIKSYYSDKISDGDIPQLIGYIDQSANRLINIVNEFLSVSRLEQGRLVFQKETFPISEIIDAVIQELHYLAETKHLSLLYENPGATLRPAIADKDKIKQILINLIGNAIKFTEKGSIIIRTKEDAKNLTVTISDTGPGIPLEHQKLLFRKFQQADNDIFSHDTSRGTGLGLYISKKLLENMDGSIQLEHSEVGHGSTFSFTIPLAAP